MGSLNLLESNRRIEWDASKKYCEKLIQNPRPFHASCVPRQENLACNESQDDPSMFSQFKQDYYLFINHFKNKIGAGVYLDVATNEPITISNTFFFDRCLHWKGICVEPNDKYKSAIARERSCKLIPTCVGNEEGKVVTFHNNGGRGGIVGETFKNMKRLRQATGYVDMSNLTCTTMRTVLRNANVAEVDYMSLDVEGHELEVLKGLGISDVVIKVISIELSQSTVSSIESFMTEHGYVRHFMQRSSRLGEDAVFLHKSVRFGHPQ